MKDEDIKKCDMKPTLLYVHKPLFTSVEIEKDKHEASAVTDAGEALPEKRDLSCTDHKSNNLEETQNSCNLNASLSDITGNNDFDEAKSGLIAKCSICDEIPCSGNYTIETEFQPVCETDESNFIDSSNLCGNADVNTSMPTFQPKSYPSTPVKRIFRFFRRATAGLLGALIIMSVPPSAGDLLELAAKNSSSAELVISCESYVPENRVNLGSDLLASVIALRLKECFLPLYDFNVLPGKPTVPDPTDPQSPIGVNLPINPRAPKSPVRRVDYDELLAPKIRPITIKPAASSADQFKGVYVQNGTSYSLDLPQLFKASLPYGELASPTVLIIHTHTSEAYTPGPLDSYTTDSSDRCSDPDYTVVRVGREIASILRSRGIEVVHDEHFYDHLYNGAFSRSLSAVKDYIDLHPSIKVVLDIHRDALNVSDGDKYAFVADINGKTAAQIMLLVGSSEAAADHPGWKDNLSLALKVQSEMAINYPDLARPIKLTRSSYNQYVAPGALIVEIGANGNSLEDAMYGGRLFALCLARVLAPFNGQ